MSPGPGTMDMDMEIEINENIRISNEEYLVLRAKNALLYDPYEAKSWMLTAQTLFPHNFGVQFEAYHIEKSARNVKEAAKCFAALFTTFPEEKELWIEIKAVTTALRLFEKADQSCENLEKSITPESDFLRQLFYQLPKTIQHALLLACAEKTPDNMEHCKLMLLLFLKFPGTVAKFGPRLMENLITAEKHSLMQHNPVNCYRKLLVCDLLPLLGESQLDLQPKNLYRLLHKAIEFYLTYVFDHSKKEDPDFVKIEEPWVKLWEIMLNIGTKLAWDLSITFAGYWNKDSYWAALLNCYQTRPPTMDDNNLKQIVYCAVLILLRCLHEYQTITEPNSERAYVLVEGFCSPLAPNEPIPKRSRMEDDLNLPVVTPPPNVSPSLIHSFIIAVRCWDLLHINEVLEREFNRLLISLKIESWLNNFRLDVALYKGQYDQLMQLISTYPDQEKVNNSLAKDLVSLSCYYCTQNYAPIVDVVAKIAETLPNCNPGANSENLGNPLTVSTRQTRHLHYLQLNRMSILQYSVKILLAALKMRKNELTLGHILVLIQLDCPVEEELLNEIIALIHHRGGFSYPIFTNYIINVDILEQFAYLSSEQGPKVPLDILPPNQQLHTQRRMSTRGVDKGQKEDLRMAIRRQVARSNEPIDTLIIKFLTRERELLHHSLIGT